jgi:hypothetical protein
MNANLKWCEYQTDDELPPIPSSWFTSKKSKVTFKQNQITKTNIFEYLDESIPDADKKECVGAKAE